MKKSFLDCFFNEILYSHLDEKRSRENVANVMAMNQSLTYLMILPHTAEINYDFRHGTLFSGQ